MSIYVAIQVPEARLREVYRLLASEPSEQTNARDDVADVDRDPAFWHSSRAIHEHLRPRSHTIKGVAQYLADRPDDVVTADEVAEALGLPYGWNSLAGALGAFGRYLANRGLDFPWASGYDQDDGKVRLTMDGRTAAAVLRHL